MVLSFEEAYKAMDNFIEKYYKKTNFGDIGSILGGMMLIEKESTADSAAWEDWIDSLTDIGIQEKRKITLEEGYRAMVQFVELNNNLIVSEEIKKLYESIEILEDKINKTNDSWKEWINSVKLIKK